MFQSIEYLKAFLGGRIGWSHFNGLIIVSGAFGLFRKDYVIAVGGYRGGYPGEDMNIIIKRTAICWKIKSSTAFPFARKRCAGRRRRTATTFCPISASAGDGKLEEHDREPRYGVQSEI